MEAFAFLSEQLEAWESLSSPMRERSRATRTILKAATSLVMPGITLNDDQQKALGSWIFDVGNSADMREIEYPQLRAMQLATYINSCYRPL